MSKIGIYAPTYNVGKYIGPMIESIKAQSFQDWTLAIVDDGSNDNSLEEAYKAKDNDKRIIISPKENHSGKIGKIKNETISLLGDVEYLASVDSDDLVIPKTLEIFNDFMDKNKDVGAACGNFICFDDARKQWSFPHVANSGEFNSEILLKYMCYFPLRFCRKEFYDIVGGYDNELTSAIDYDLALKLDEVCKIKRIKNPVTYHYRQHSIQVSSRERPKQDANAKIALERAIKRRGLDYKVVNNKPPFILEPKEESHFIWGKKS